MESSCFATHHAPISPCRLRSPHVESCPRRRLRFIPAVLQLGLLLRDLLTCASLRRPRARKRFVFDKTKLCFASHDRILATTNQPSAGDGRRGLGKHSSTHIRSDPTTRAIPPSSRRNPIPPPPLPRRSEQVQLPAATADKQKRGLSPTGFVPRVLPASGYRRLKTYAVSLTLHRPRFSAPPTIQKTRRPWLVARQSYPRRHAKSAAVGDEATKTNLRQLPRACRLAFGCLLGLVLPESPPRSRRERGP